MEMRTIRPVKIPHQVEFRIFGNHLSTVIRGATGNPDASLLTHPDHTFDRSVIESWLGRYKYDGTQVEHLMLQLVSGNVLAEVKPDTFQVTPDAIDIYTLASRA